ncbi:MAG: peptidoglycan-binding protein LysM [Pseudomonadota bacterium]|nr:peptidoglycan-binding protein LysM [Pseudomonadota bacterium]
MGLFSFIKDAGANIFGYDTTEEAAAKKADQVKEFVAKYEFAITDFGVVIDDEKATLTGEADSAATKEKVILTVGNLDGIAEVDDQLTVAETEQAPEAQFYTVKSGDTLSKIAIEFYGSAGKYPVIFEANKPMLSDPDKIYPGQTLRIPAL